MRLLLPLLLLTSSCAAYTTVARRAWRKDGACVVVCDYRTGYMNAVLTLSPFACRCVSPELREISSSHVLPLVAEADTLYCYGGCVAEAEAILKRQPWRRQYSDPFDDPLEQVKRDWEEQP